MRAIPDLGGELVTTQEVFELLLVLGAIEHKPITGGVTNAVAKNQIQAPSNLVNEVVHIAVKAAIVVACKEQALLLVDEYPSGEVNCGHSCQMPAVVDVPRSIVHQPEKEGESRASE